MAELTRGLNVSLIYLARVEGGAIVIDLGWSADGRALRRGLERLGAGTDEVIAVFLTHAHRDHAAGWRAVRGAPFHMAAPEVDRFLGREAPRGWIPRFFERLRPADGPARGEVRITEFGRDTVFAFGSDTLRAFLVPGHTAGSAAYLFRGVLFVGDALARPPLLGFRESPSGFADDAELARRSLKALWERIAAYRVDRVCTAHAKCAPYDDAFRARVERRGGAASTHPAKRPTGETPRPPAEGPPRPRGPAGPHPVRGAPDPAEPGGPGSVVSRTAPAATPSSIRQSRIRAPCPISSSVRPPGPTRNPFSS